ncbi:MAG TPA: L-threonine 3-dehydrogenase [Acidobacteriaceae bacterium]|nr:L-threonine 3-dehydrogenase [Acidobacteriaceae bacterium]
MSQSMQAIVKTGAHPGVEIREVPVPSYGPSEVLVKVESASVCGTDVHIYDWDPWAEGRLRPPLIPGHEFCGTVAKVGEDVTTVRPGDFVSAEMHVACGKCLQCRIGQAHVCQNVRIIGVDSNGAFANYVVIPESNIWKLDPALPREYASILDPLGNAVHSVLAGEIAARSVAVVGCGPIGLFAIAVARACGASAVYALEVNEHRRDLAHAMHADFVLDPTREDVAAEIAKTTGGIGVDVMLEMSGHPDGMRLGFEILRTGGRVSLLGIPAEPVEIDFARDIIFKGATVVGINGRKMYETWFQMEALLRSGKLDLLPVITHRLPMAEFAHGMDLLKSGEASKIILTPLD